MSTWQKRITDIKDKRELLIESSQFVSKVKLSKGLKESLSMQSGKAGTLIVKNIPVTILDRENLNGRIYSTETMRQAILEAADAMANKETLGQANEHPESSFVAPTDASHVIVNAYIKENINIVVDGKKERHNVLFTDWEVLNTTHGKDLRALFEAECSFGTSIRGVGELSGKMVENYSFISVDGVGNPSSSTYTRMPVSESVKVEFKDENELKENYTVMSSSTNVVRDLSQAGVLQQRLNANPYGTITKTSTKVDQETDPKTGAQTSITTVEADTEDEVSDLASAFQMAQKAMTNGISKVSSITIEANEDEDAQGNRTESVENGLEAYVPESTTDDIESSKEQAFDELKQLIKDNSLYFFGVYDFEDSGIEDWELENKANEFINKYANGKTFYYKNTPANGVDEDAERLAREFLGETDNVYESVMTESKKEEEKDPREFMQYILKIKDNDSKMEEGSEDEPEFVAMKGNAIRFTKDPKKALHFTQGMEESGIVHYSNIQKLLADMGYGENNLEKWYKKETNEVSPENNKCTTCNEASCKGKKLEEDGNTRYSATIEIINKGGLPELKSLPISSNDLTGALKEVSNHWVQQESSNDVTKVNKMSLVDNQTQEKYIYNHDENRFVPENELNVPSEKVDNNVRFVEPEAADLELENESADGEIKQDDNVLGMDIDDNTHIEKEFDTPAQASVAKAGIESGKLGGDVLLSDSAEENDVKPGWYVAHDKIGVCGPYETREACMEGLDGFEDDVSVYEVTEDDLNEVLFKNPSEPSDEYIDKPLNEKSCHKLGEAIPVLSGLAAGIDGIGYGLRGIGKVADAAGKGVGKVIGSASDLASSGFDHLTNFSRNYKKDKPVAEDNNNLGLKKIVDIKGTEVTGPDDEELWNVSNELREFDNKNDMKWQRSFKSLSDAGVDQIYLDYALGKDMVNESCLVPVRFSNIKWDEKDAVYRMFEDIENDMKISHIEPDIKNANVLVEYFEDYMKDLNNASVSYKVNPSDIKESSNYKEEIISLYNKDNGRKYPKIETADINLG